MFDTAGLRKRARIEDKVEKLAAGDAIRAAKFAEVVVVLLDATIALEKQDLTIIDLIEREGRAVVIGLNKWDLIEARGSMLSNLREEAQRLLPQVKGCPIVPLSGLAGQGIDKLMEGVVSAWKVWNARVSTSRLNRWLEGVTQNHPPPAVSGRRIKLRYATQVKTRRRISRCSAISSMRCRGLSPLSREFDAREFRPAGHADPPQPADDRQPYENRRKRG